MIDGMVYVKGQMNRVVVFARQRRGTWQNFKLEGWFLRLHEGCKEPNESWSRTSWVTKFIDVTMNVEAQRREEN